MPRSPTPAQAEASRRNGQRSRGPATPEGKARSAQNARTFGLRSARIVLLENEDDAHFDQLHQAVNDRFQPSCALEAAICARMVRALWRAERAQELETSFWSLFPPKIASDDPRAQIRILHDDQDRHRTSLPTILRYLTEADRAFTRALRDLEQLRRGVADPLEDAAAPDDAPTCTNEPEPANDDQAEVQDATSEPEPLPAPVLEAPAAEEPRVLEVPAEEEPDDTDEPKPALAAPPVRTEPPAAATPAERAIHELSYLRRWIASRWLPHMHAPAEAFVLKFGPDGKGQPAWVQDLPEGTRLARMG